MSMQLKVFTLHKYFIWADRMRFHFEEMLRRRGTTANDDLSTESNMYMSLWYGCMYVVVEGWQRLGLSDPAIDGLLVSPNTPLLKRYRNGVFHFQENYFDDRFVELIRDGEDVAVWIRQLRDALSAYFLHWLDAQDRTDRSAGP